jgi:RNA polymerase sigma factor (sigma-70 family)
MEYSVKYLKQNAITLNNDEIKELFNDRYTNSDKIARSQFKLLLMLLGKHRFNKITQEEQISAGLYALTLAIKHYNLDYDVDFSVFYYNVALQQFAEATRMENIIKMPTAKDRLEKYKEVKAINVSSILPNKKDGEETEFFETYIKEDVDGFTEDLSRYDELCKVVKEAFPENKQRYADIVIATFGLCGMNEKLTQEEIAVMYGISKQAINQIKIKAIKKLKNNKEFINYLKQTYHE